MGNLGCTDSERSDIQKPIIDAQRTKKGFASEQKAKIQELFGFLAGQSATSGKICMKAVSKEAIYEHFGESPLFAKNLYKLMMSIHNPVNFKSFSMPCSLSRKPKWKEYTLLKNLEAQIT